jgi:hypothetical protein
MESTTAAGEICWIKRVGFWPFLGDLWINFMNIGLVNFDGNSLGN